MLKHLLWILPFFVPPGDDWALLLLFWMLFLHQSGTFLHLLLRCIIIIIIIIILNVIITIIGRLKPGWHAHSYSLFSNPGIVTSLLNLVVFLDVEFFTLDLSC